MTKLETSMGCVALFTTLTVGCFSLEALSSYSAGMPATSEPPAPMDAGVGGTSSSAAPPDGEAFTPDAGVGESNDNEQPLGPSELDFEPPTAAVDSEPCDGPGELPGLVASTCYRVVNDLNGWFGARSECEDWGGDLVEITTAEENQLLAEEVEDDVWIGARDGQNEGDVIWNSGAPMDFTAWAPAQPDNFQGQENCVELRELDGLWNDAPCMSMKSALCERSD